MNKKRKYINRGRNAVKVGDVVIRQGAEVQLDESLWERADETPGLYRDLSETVGQQIELVG